MATYVALAVKDSYMIGIPIANQTVNYGGVGFSSCHAAYALGSKAALARAIGNFDVSALAGREIVAATLVLVYNLAFTPAECIVSRCTRPASWVENQVTWKRYSSGNLWTAGGGDFNDAGPPAAVTFVSPSTTGALEVGGMLPFVEDALANRDGIVSLVIRLTDEDPGHNAGGHWRSREFGTDVWRLEVDYFDPSVEPRRSSQRGEAASRATKPARARRGVRPTAPARPARRTVR